MGFENIKTIEGWSDALKGVLERAHASKKQAERHAISLELVNYTIKSSAPDQSDAVQRAAILQMDSIARRASEHVLIEELQERVTAITSRLADLAALTKAFKKSSDNNTAAAGSISLKWLKGTITSANQLISAIKEVKDTAVGKDEDLRKRLKEAFESVQALRNLLEKST